MTTMIDLDEMIGEGMDPGRLADAIALALKGVRKVSTKEAQHLGLFLEGIMDECETREHISTNEPQYRHKSSV